MTAAAVPPSSDAVPERLTPERLAAENRQTDTLLAWLLGGLTFLLASFPVEDPQVLFSLAVGRMVAQGEFDFGADPFSYTTGDAVWVHPGWLGDWLLYLVHQAGGGAGLVLLRGVVALAIFLLMWSMQRPGGNRMAAVVTLFLAVLTMSPRLLVRTELFSVLLLVLTLRLLWQHAQPKGPPTSWWRRWSGGRFWIFLPPLFALWVNLDSWFLLGPALTAAWLGGCWLQYRFTLDAAQATVQRGELKRLALVLGAGLAACVVNPYHVRVFRLPAELSSPTLDVLNEAYRSRQLNLSPAQRFRPPESQAAAALRQQQQALGEEEVQRRTDLIWRPLGLALTEWSYYPLFMLGFMLLPFPAGRGLLVGIPAWLLFFALSVYQVRNMAFFAVVAGPLTVLAWQSRAMALPAVGRLAVLLGQLGRFVVLLALLGSAYLMTEPVPELLDPRVRGIEAVRGWINPRGSLGWSMPLDPSLVKIHQEMHAWRRSGSWPSDAGQVFHVDLFDAPAYQAYFDPGARHFMDARFELHANTVTAFQEAYAALRRAGQPGTQAQIEQRNAIWQRLFREWDVSCLIVDQRSVLNPQNPREAVPLYQLLLNDTDPQTGQPHWTVLRYADGRNFLLGWNGSRNWDRLKEQRLDVRREVFQQTSPPPPVSEPPPPPRESLLAVRLRGNVERPPLPLLEAEWHANLLRSALLQVEQIERQRPEQISHLWMHVGSVLASGTFQVPMLWIRDMVPHAEAYLAARSARFAIAAATNLVNPVEVRYRAGAYKALHDAYQAIYRLEARLLPGMPQPPQRELQIVSAMRQVVDLNPFDAFTHQDLAVYYLRRLGSNGQPEPIIDLGIDHYRKALAIFQQLTAGDPRRTPADVEIQFKRRLHELHGFKIDEIEKELKQRTEAWAAQAPRRNPLKPTENLAQRAGFALQLGLAGLALEELRTALTNITPGTTLSGGELLLYADVHLRIGEVVPILELLAVPGVEARLGSANYHAFGAMAKAAAGDYAGSIAHRRQLIANTELDMVSVLLLAGRLHTLGGDEPRGTHFTAVEQGGLQASSFANLLSEHWVSIGLLELEAGRPQEAAAAFRHACRDVQRPSPFEGLAARYYFLITGRFLDQEQP